MLHRILSLLILLILWEDSASWEASLDLQGHALYPRWSLVLGTWRSLDWRFASVTYPSSSVGLLYLWSADSIRKGTANGLEGALGEDEILVCSR